MSRTAALNRLTDAIAAVTAGAAVLICLVHLMFAYAVWKNGRWLLEQEHRNTEMVAPRYWAMATLLGGVFVAAVFWLVHFSTLNPYMAARIRKMDEPVEDAEESTDDS